MNFLKIVIFLIIALGLAIYFITQSPVIFKNIEIGPKLPTPSYQAPVSNYVPPSYSPSYIPQQPSAAPLPYQIPSDLTRDQISSYYGKAKISSVSAYSYGNYPSQITLYSYVNSGETIDITNWKLKSGHGEIIIPQAVAVYDPSGLTPSSDIILKSGDYVNIYSNASPLARNFRINKCMGYFSNIYNFTPPLYTSCPLPYSSRSDISHLSGYCQNYILSLGGCMVPNSNFYNSLPDTADGNLCRAYLDNFNYGSCFNKYRSDNDFLTNEWRVWVNQSILDVYHDKLLLLDSKGLVVNEYIY